MKQRMLLEMLLVADTLRNKTWFLSLAKMATAALHNTCFQTYIYIYTGCPSLDFSILKISATGNTVDVR